MKLDYLQFLELEVFTRFGARLEASIEAKIKRGRMLREVLKQDRLSPLPVEFQMAWMVAYNEGLLDALSSGEIPAVLHRLAEWVRTADSVSRTSHEDWKRAVKNLCDRAPRSSV